MFYKHEVCGGILIILFFYMSRYSLCFENQNYSTINTKSSLNLFSLVTFACGKVASLSQWDRRQSTNIQSEYQGLICGQEECPWQVNKPRLILQTSCLLFMYTLQIRTAS